MKKIILILFMVGSISKIFAGVFTGDVIEVTNCNGTDKCATGFYTISNGVESFPSLATHTDGVHTIQRKRVGGNNVIVFKDSTGENTQTSNKAFYHQMYSFVTFTEPPRISTSTSQIAYIGESFSLTGESSDSTATWSATSKPNWLNISSAGVFNGTPTSKATHTFDVTISKNGCSSTKSFTIEVKERNTTPTIDTNSILTLLEGENKTITNTILSSSDADNNTILYYTLITPPQNGILYKSGIALNTNDTFTQANIDANDINYTNNGDENTSDSFVFNVKDQSDTTTNNTTFNITITPVNDKPMFSLNITDINISEDFNPFDLNISNIIDQESQDLNISVELNDTSIINFALSKSTNITYADYNAKDINISIFPIANKYGKVECNVTVNDGIDKLVKDFNITITPVDDNNTIITQLSNLSKDINFDEFNVSINIDDIDMSDINLTVDVNDSLLVEFNQTWYKNDYNLTYSEYHNKDINLSIKSKPNIEGVVKFIIKVEDNKSNEVNTTFDLNISAYSAVLADFNQLNITNSTTSNLTLPTIGSINQSSINWVSSNSSYISNSGVVIQPTSDTIVTLKANLTIANTTLSKEFNVTVIGKPIVVNNSSNGGNFSAVVINSGNINNSSFDVKISSDLEKEVIDTTTTKTVQTKETTLTDGTTSQTKIEIPKDTTQSTNLKATVEVTNLSEIEKTTLEAEDGVKVSISNDRSVTSKVEINQIEAEVKVNSNAEAEAKIIVQKKVEVTMKTPKGTEIKQENSGRVISKVSLKADTIKGINPVEIQMSAEVDGNLVTVAKVTDKNKKVTTYRLTLPNNIIRGDMELVKSNIDDNTYSAIKSTFKTSSNFILNQNSRRVIVEGENIQVIGTSSWQKFEEKQYFNGKRTIMLILGSAKILKDGKEEEMEKNIEYEFLPSSTSQTSNGNLTEIYNNSYLNIQKGWNLISNPIDEELNIAKTFKYSATTFKYSNSWIENPTIINQNEGLWINYTTHITEKIEGNSYYENFSNLNSGWNLLGVGKDTTSSELNQFSEIWVYDSKIKSWIKNPNIIYRGYGFWGKI